MKKLIFILLLIPFSTNSQTLIADTIYAIGGTGTQTTYVKIVNYRNEATTTIATRGSLRAGTVTQLTNKSTAVTLNTLSGRITMANSALSTGAEASFTLNNSFIAATDVIIVNVASAFNGYLTGVSAVSNGSCVITISNVSTGSLSQALVLNFLILK